MSNDFDKYKDISKEYARDYAENINPYRKGGFYISTDQIKLVKGVKKIWKWFRK